MTNHGDITKIHGGNVEPAWVVIGGFPLIWKELGGTTVWTSEIEPFCGDGEEV